ncbi:lysozyme inhibitor LprI family protein [Rhizobium sp. LjRoot30]|uniref:lysozyme inhibitor LprI family protein n=1 Tax=Rhizobium sp. LjRoot30 TaxID=3342320 RepID=UPI003ECD1E8A
MSRWLMAEIALAAMLGFSGLARAEEDPPIDCDNAQAQVEMNICAYRDFEAADKELNAQYKKTRAAMVEMDAMYEAEQRGAEKALLKAQRAWIDYRDGHCEAYGFEAHLGSMEPMLISGCQAELTRARTKELKALAEGPEN